nr:hypothetical protein [Tanacetum cinerariifolium]
MLACSHYRNVSKQTTRGLAFKHDYTIIDSPRAVKFPDRYGVRMIMRLNEIHKFSDGTLEQIDEALDFRKPTVHVCHPKTVEDQTHLSEPRELCRWKNQRRRLPVAEKNRVRGGRICLPK